MDMAKWNLEWFIAGMLGLIAAIAAGDWLYIFINFAYGLLPAEPYTEGMAPFGSFLTVVTLAIVTAIACATVGLAGMFRSFIQSVTAAF